MNAPPQSGRTTMQHPWISRASSAQLAAVAIGCGLATWLLIAGSDLLAAAYNEASLIVVGAVNALAGFLVGALVMNLLLASRARYQRLTRQLITLAEMNNQIRNALERIELSAHLSHNRELIEEIDEASAQIESALRELLPESEAEEE